MTFKSLSLFYFLSFLFVISRAIRLDIQNNCPNTVWAAAVPGGGKRLYKGETWTLDVKPGTLNASIWARTNCKFDEAGRGKCESGDCGGLLKCRASGQPPHTLAELAFNQSSDNIDLFDISLANGFNVPIEISPTSENCSRGSKCVGDVNGPCPQELRDPGGCNNPCTVFTNDQFCCTTSGSRCEATNYSKFFKAICPDAVTYLLDDTRNSFACPSGANYKVVFCPNVSSNSQNGGTNVAKVTIKNNCPRTIWPATQIGGGQQLSTTGYKIASGASNTIDVPPPWNGRFWARTHCTTDAAGKFTCGTGDCGSGQVSCNGLSGAPPTTLVEINFQGNGGQDFYDVSNVDGFNIPASVVPEGGNGDCKPSQCIVNINAVCKPELQVKTTEGEVIGCKSACSTFGDPKYCCTGDFNMPETCPPTDYSRFFEEQCPEAYSYAYDVMNSTFTCFGGPNYLITFCP